MQLEQEQFTSRQWLKSEEQPSSSDQSSNTFEREFRYLRVRWPEQESQHANLIYRCRSHTSQPTWIATKRAARHSQGWEAHHDEKTEIREWWPLRRNLGHISAAIQNSRSLLALVDEEDAQMIARETWERAVKFLSDQARTAYNFIGTRIDAPLLLPGPAGSIDLYWKKPMYELLVNIPADANTPVSYYGDDKKGNSLKGTIVSETDRGFVWWLTSATYIGK